MSRPLLPPRRTVPAVPVQSSADDDEIAKPMGIAARIASLQLDQKGHPLAKPPPPAPRARAEPRVLIAAVDDEQTTGVPCPTPEELAARGPDYIRLISRPVPSPHSFNDAPPPPPPRRLPPKPTRLPTPPPEPEPEPEPEPAATESCLKCHDFSYVDAHAAQFPRHTVHSLDALASDLTSPFDSETEKCRALFTWMHHNIAYDCDAFFSGNLRAATAESTLHRARRLRWVRRPLSLPRRARRHPGDEGRRARERLWVPALGPDAPTPPFQGNHAWNCVLMDGDWRLIDCCWGAGALEGAMYTPRFTPSWFTATPAEFGRRHFPEDPGYQLIAPDDGGPVSWEQYILEPPGPVIFKDFYELNFHPYLIQPPEQHLQGGSWVSFQIFKFCEHMSREEQDNYVYFINLPDGTRTPLRVGEEGAWGASIYIPSGGGELSLYYVTSCGGQDAKGLGVAGFERANGRKAMSFGGMLRWTVV
ncbi:hypothetical protein CPB85DRAFT_1305497 [Mucidula mucida]|nr:hypothetical protein CPB85DRAFT_1305497 [Mucidula mucida]